MEKQKVYLCDIDGTLADKGLRNPFDESKVLNDFPLPTCNVVKALIEQGNKVIFLSGRTDHCYNNSIEWLKKYVDPNPILHMRRLGDYRGDDIVKEEMYNKFIKEDHTVIGVFDDRLKVCRMWYKLGLFVYNCNQGLREF